MKSTEPIVTEPGLKRRLGAALVILRVALGVFLLVWGLEKFIITPRSIAIYDYFYGISASDAFAYVLGGLESLLALAIMIGALRRWSYGIGLLAHAVTTAATIRLIVDPWGLISGEPQHLYFAAVPILAGFMALYLLRDLDYFSFDEWRVRRLSRVRSS
ncbi:MAG: DoxX family membrane protein [Betaproteobacteria bacterium]|nr:DoxX family membrane protein [Betaproteobacteria bacterium]